MGEMKQKSREIPPQEVEDEGPEQGGARGEGVPTSSQGREDNDQHNNHELAFCRVGVYGFASSAKTREEKAFEQCKALDACVGVTKFPSGKMQPASMVAPSSKLHAARSVHPAQVSYSHDPSS